MAARRISIKRLAGMALGIYLVCDGFLGGPLSKTLLSFVESRGSHIVARVHGREITRSELDRQLHARLWLEGKSPDKQPTEILAATRKAALNDLIDEEILRAKSSALASQLTIPEAEINERLSRFTTRFENQRQMETAMKSQGIADAQALRERLAEQIRHEKYLESKLSSMASISDDEAKQWFAAHAKELDTPERVEARHIFIATLDHPPEEAKAKLETALADLTAKKKDFATLAKELSEDPANKDRGGALGWITRERLPVDFADPVFSLPPNSPTLLRTRLGWHLVEVTQHKPAEARTFDQAKPEVIAALLTVKRAEALDKLRSTLRSNSANSIEIFDQSLLSP